VRDWRGLWRVWSRGAGVWRRAAWPGQGKHSFSPGLGVSTGSGPGRGYCVAVAGVTPAPLRRLVFGKARLFARIHQTLSVNPAMEAGISNHVWTMEEIVALIGE